MDRKIYILMMNIVSCLWLCLVRCVICLIDQYILGAKEWEFYNLHFLCFAPVAAPPYQLRVGFEDKQKYCAIMHKLFHPHS